MPETLTRRAKEIGYSEYRSGQVGSDQQLANAAESIAIQLSLINQKLDLIIEAIENLTLRF
jgi:hypothetical protein